MMRALLLLPFGLLLACSDGAVGTVRLGLGGDCSLTSHGGCASGYCARLDTGAAVCSESCGTDAACAPGWSCRLDRDPSVCVPSVQQRGCTDDASCPAAHECSISGACVVPAQRTSCVRCSDDAQCAVGLRCTALGPGLAEVCLSPCVNAACGDAETCVEGMCIPNSACGESDDLCASCMRDADCGGRDDYCVRNVQLGASFCGRNCPLRKKIERVVSEHFETFC